MSENISRIFNQFLDRIARRTRLEVGFNEYTCIARPLALSLHNPPGWHTMERDFITRVVDH